MTMPSSVAARLELEVERDAEALAEREAPRAVDAATERRVQDELHAARLVEEAFGDDRRLRGHGAQGGDRRRHVGDELLCAAAVDRALGDNPVHRRRTSGRRDATSCRSADTASDSSRVRAGASPSQNGTDGGAPCASTTRTRPLSTRLMRHDRLPRRKMSPAMLSTAKSSFTVPTRWPCGSSTTS
jgi:hypothetical protein